MRAILLRKILKYCATNTDSTDHIARSHKNFLEIKLWVTTSNNIENEYWTRKYTKKIEKNRKFLESNAKSACLKLPKVNNATLLIFALIFRNTQH